MTQSDPKYVSASRPINQRTAKPEVKTERINPIVQERLAAKWANQQIKSRFGTPLAQQFQVSATPAQPPTMRPLFISGGVVAAVSAVSLMLATMAHSLLFAGAGAFSLAAGVGLMVISRRSDDMSERQTPAATAFFDEASLLAFDRALQSMEADAPVAIITALTALKQQLARIGHQAINVPVDEHFTMDDWLYLTELLRRYLPDSLHAYLMVPKDQRAAPVLDGGETAVSLLLAQLKLLGTELDQREKKLTRSKADNLLRQQRFLESKSSL